MKISIFTPQVISEVGGRQSEFHIYPEKAKVGADTKLFMVCDGIGGKEKSAIASQLASHSFAQYFEKHPPILISSTYIQKALDFTEKEFDQYLSVKPEEKGMGTTLGLLYFNEQGAIWAGVGDSRLYHFRDETLITVLDGQIDIQESDKVSPLNAIQGKIEKAAKPVVQIIDEIEEGDSFLLCTVGVLENLSEEHLIDIIATKESDDFKNQQLGVHISKRPAVNSSSFLITIKAIEPDEVLPTLAERAAQTAKVAKVRTVAPITEKVIEKEVVEMEVEQEKIIVENKIDDDVIPGLDKGEKLEMEKVKVTERVEAVRQKEGGVAEVLKRVLYASLIVMGIVFASQWISGIFSKNKLKNSDSIAQTDDLPTENATDTNNPIEQKTNKSPIDNRTINSTPAVKDPIPTASNQETVTIIDGPSVTVPKTNNGDKTTSLDGNSGQEAVNNINEQSINRAKNEGATKNSPANSGTTNSKPIAPPSSSNNVKKTSELTQKQSAQLKKQGLARYGVLSEGFMAVSKNGKKGFVNKNATLVIPCQYDDVQAFNAGYAGVKYKGRWTFINKNGYFITKKPTYQFLNVLPFSSNKLAPVQVNFEGVENKWGYITTNGQRAIPYRFDKAGVFKGGKANVLIGNKSFMINEKGDCLGNCPDNY